MQEEIILDSLSDKNVIVVKKIIAEDGYIRIHRVGYDNTVNGRKQVKNEVGEPYKSAIMLMWGNEPTIIETDI